MSHVFGFQIVAHHPPRGRGVYEYVPELYYNLLLDLYESLLHSYRDSLMALRYITLTLLKYGHHHYPYNYSTSTFRLFVVELYGRALLHDWSTYR